MGVADIESWYAFRMKELSNQVKFEETRSPLREAYDLLGAHTPLELSNLYSEEDQKLMKSESWDYDNADLIINRIKSIIENVDIAKLTDEEKNWRNEILWFWYHHAISCAVWRYKDREKAKSFSLKALEFQDGNHPNQITKLLGLLIDDKIEEAEKWTNKITDEIEKETATYLIQEYKDGNMF